MSINSHEHTPDHDLPASAPARRSRSVLAWPAWLRVAMVLPLVLLLWLAVLWANEGMSL